MQGPDQRQREQYGEHIRENIESAGYGRCQKDIDARAWSFRIPSFMHGHALKNGEKDFGNIVGCDEKGKAPQDGGKAGNETEDAVEEEKSGVFEDGRANAVENFHRDDSLSGVSLGNVPGMLQSLKGRFRRGKQYSYLGVCCWVFEEDDMFTCSKMYR